MQQLAPIALFTYNRPQHTLTTLKYLQANELAAESRLFIFCDAARSPADEAAVQQVREICSSVTGFKSVQLHFAAENQGLAQAIINGVTMLLNTYGRVIVFEDDLISSKYTLQYFNEALELYKSEDSVMHIGAYMYPIPAGTLPESFFYRAATSWGWATWQRAWQHFNTDIDSLIPAFSKQQQHAFSINGSMNYWRQMLDFKAGRNNSWAIRWYASIFLRGGLCLSPAKSLINNIGHDGTGVHSGVNNIYNVQVSTQPVKYFPAHVKEDAEAVQLIQHFLRHRKGSLVQRIIRYARQRFFNK